MKKFFVIAAVLLMLTACGAEQEEMTETKKIGDRGYDEQTFDTGEQEDERELIPEEECDFGHFQWGMPIEDVVYVQGGGYSRVSENTIRYERVRIEGFASDAEYTFTDNKLSEATYFIMPDSEYEDKTKYIDDYEALSQIYTERFGKPVTDETQFSKGMDTKDKVKQGELLEKGFILFRRIWQTDTTEIRAVMAKKDGLCIGVKISPVNK